MAKFKKNDIEILETFCNQNTRGGISLLKFNKKMKGRIPLPVM